MAFLIIIIANIIAGLTTWMLYKPEWKASNYVFVAGLAAALLNNFLWIYLTKRTPEASEIQKYAAYWDGILCLQTMLIPVIFYGVEMTIQSGTGLALIFIGMMMLRLTF